MSDLAAASYGTPDEYTPTTEQVRSAATSDCDWLELPAFDRWLAAEKAKWQAEALRDAADELGQQGTEPWNRNSLAIFTLQLRAARIEKGEQG